ncbi:MAG: MBL fold metallo-hydrolase [Flavobacteriales bacterium]
MITIQKWTLNPFQENTFGIADSQGNALIIDPGMYQKEEKDAVEQWLKEHGFNSIQVWLTHGHLDHVFGCDFLFQKFGVLPIIHQLDLPTLAMAEKSADVYGVPMDPCPQPKEFIEVGKTLHFAGQDVEVIFLPGHAPGHVGFYFPEDQVVFSGDVLFKQSVGRTDLPGGNEQVLRESIEYLYENLPAATVVCNGHGDETTIGAEARENPYVNAAGSGFFQGK